MPIKVLMFGWELPPFNSGGLGTACHGLASALSDQDIEITFVLPARVAIKTDKFRLVFADLENFDWSKLTAYPSQVDFGPNHPLFSDYIAAARAYGEQAAKVASHYGSDLVHAHDWLCFPAGSTASSVLGVPLINHVHATEFDRSGGGYANPAVFSIEKSGMENADAVIAVSNFTKNLLSKHYGTADSKVAVVHNGVNSDDFSGSDVSDLLKPLKDVGYKLVLYAGRLTLQKGVDYFLKSAQTVLEYQPKTVFMIVGSGDMENQLVKMTVELGISDRVLFAGFLRGEQLKSAFKAADVFVMPSVSEPFGITALESVACGTPVIISKQSGVSEAVIHVLKTDFWDTDQMSNQILSVINYPSLKTSLREQGSIEVKKNNWESAAAKTIKVYQSVLSKKKSPKEK